MAKRRFLISFSLSMPYRPLSSSWGKDRNFVLYRSLDFGDVVRLFDSSQPGTQRSWNHAWPDGWGARVDGRVMAPGETRKKSDGFNGYDWMVDNIIRHGSTTAPPAPVEATA